MELKRSVADSSISCSLSFNRTTMELKQQHMQTVKKHAKQCERTKLSQFLKACLRDAVRQITSIAVKFNRSHKTEEYHKYLDEIGLTGGTLDVNGKSALLYNSESFDNKSQRKVAESTQIFNLEIPKIETLDSQGIQEKIHEEGFTRLWELKRGEQGSLQTTYKRVLNALYPRISQATRARL